MVFLPGPLRAFSNPQGSEPPSNVLKLDEILANVDKAGKEFASMAGDLEYTKVTVIVNDHSTERGKIYFERNAGKTRVMMAILEPAEKYVLFADGKVSLYNPKIAEVDEYQLSQKQDLVEEFLLLGFGTSVAELQKSYQVSYQGPESVDGRQAHLLGLIPKSVKVAAQIQRVQLWISPQTWQPVQQKFYEPGGDYFTARYSNMKWNTKIPAKSFQLPLKGKVRTVRPQAP